MKETERTELINSICKRVFDACKTNNEILLDYLKKGNIVTTKTAPKELGIADVRANIRDLRHAGIPIKDRWIISKNRRGRKTRCKEYFLEDEINV